jgi:hypothetical protein
MVLSAPPSLRAQFAHLTLQSQPGDFIGQGGNFDIIYTPANSQFFSASVVPTTPIPSFLRFTLGTVTGGSDNTFTTLDFGTNQLGIPIQPGFYANAQRASFASAGHPGLDVSFQNRGCNTLTGNFTVTDVTFGANNAIQSFSATFEQHCEGAVPALFGTFTYSATGVPEPSAWALMLTGLGLFAVCRVARKGNRGACGLVQ